MGRIRIAAGALPLILLMAACSSAASPSPTTPSQPAASQPAASQPAASEAASPSESAATAEAYDVKIATGAVGSYLTGEDGKTLYIFKKDTADSGKSACGAGPCLDNWPPFAVESLDELKPDSGVTGKLALITRDDGTMQVTYKGMPLYYFAGDKAAGDTNGSAIPNWAVANP
ncbi:MAG TPA: hypothetical protein VK194_03235 [Candidatus Deferrimicrobium sp.]|nr:hypothetical protein [Candidatus Deferrimicrobium sp.]